MMLSEEFERTLAAQIIMLSPVTPHFASELWAGFSSMAACPSIKKVRTAVHIWTVYRDVIEDMFSDQVSSSNYESIRKAKTKL